MPKNKKNNKNPTNFSKDKERLQSILAKWHQYAAEIEKLETNNEYANRNQLLKDFIAESFKTITCLSWKISGYEGSGLIRSEYGKLHCFPVDQISKIEDKQYKYVINGLDPIELKTTALDIACKTKQVLSSFYNQDSDKPKQLIRAEKSLKAAPADNPAIYKKLIFRDFDNELLSLTAIKSKIENILASWDDYENLTAEKQLELLNLITQEAGERSQKLRGETCFLTETGVFSKTTGNKLYSLFDSFYKIRHRSKDFALNSGKSNNQLLKSELKYLKQVFDASCEFWPRVKTVINALGKKFETIANNYEEMQIFNVALNGINPQKITPKSNSSHKVSEIIGSIYMSLNFIKESKKINKLAEGSNASGQKFSNYQLQKQALVILKNNLEELWLNTNIEPGNIYLTRAPVSEIVKNVTMLRNFIVHEDQALNTNILLDTMNNITNFSNNVSALVCYTLSKIWPNLDMIEKKANLHALRPLAIFPLRDLDKIQTQEDREAFHVFLKIYSAGKLGMYKQIKDEFAPDSIKFWQLLSSDKVNSRYKAKMLDAVNNLIKSNFDKTELNKFEQSLKHNLAALVNKSNSDISNSGQLHKLHNETTISQELQAMGVINSLEGINNWDSKLYKILEYGLNQDNNSEEVANFCIWRFNSELENFSKLISSNKTKIVKLFKQVSSRSDSEEIKTTQVLLNKFMEVVINLNNLIPLGYFKNNNLDTAGTMKQAFIDILSVMHELCASLSGLQWKLLYQDSSQPIAKAYFLNYLAKFAINLEESDKILEPEKEAQLVKLRSKVIKNNIEKFKENGWGNKSQSIKIDLAYNYLKYIVSEAIDKYGNKKTEAETNRAAIEECLDKALESLLNIKNKSIILKDEAVSYLVTTLSKKCLYTIKFNEMDGLTHTIDAKTIQYLKIIKLLDYLYPGAVNSNHKHQFEELLEAARNNKQSFKPYALLVKFCDSIDVDGISSKERVYEDFNVPGGRELYQQFAHYIEAAFNKDSTSSEDKEESNLLGTFSRSVENLIQYLYEIDRQQEEAAEQGEDNAGPGELSYDAYGAVCLQQGGANEELSTTATASAASTRGDIAYGAGAAFSECAEWLDYSGPQAGGTLQLSGELEAGEHESST